MVEIKEKKPNFNIFKLLMLDNFIVLKKRFNIIFKKLNRTTIYLKNWQQNNSPTLILPSNTVEINLLIEKLARIIF